MGNSSTASMPPPVSETNVSSNDSLVNVQTPSLSWSHDVLWSFILTLDSMSSVISGCRAHSGGTSWLGVKIFMMVMALLANCSLMWLLLRRRGAMTPSELLGLNVAVMDILYCLCLPLYIYTNVHESSEDAHSAASALYSFCFFGCPLLLTFMCLERYMAAAWPINYLQLARREYRVVLCAAAWILTAAMVLVAFFIGGMSFALCMCATILVLFFIMLLSLLGIVAVLRQKGPGESSGSPLRRRALNNVLTVMVPSVVAYAPLLVLIVYLSIIISRRPPTADATQCIIIEVLLLFPNCGLFIGPMFYLSRVKTRTCCRKNQQNQTSGPQEETRSSL